MTWVCPRCQYANGSDRDWCRACMRDKPKEPWVTKLGEGGVKVVKRTGQVLAIAGVTFGTIGILGMAIGTMAYIWGVDIGEPLAGSGLVALLLGVVLTGCGYGLTDAAKGGR